MNMPSLPNEVIVGKEFSETLGYTVGNQFEISIATRDSYKTETVTITGIFDLKVSSLNKTWVVSDINTVQDLFDTGTIASTIEIQLLDVFASDTILPEVTAALPPASLLRAVDWKAQNESLLSGLNGQTISSLMIQVFVVISVVLSIASVLIISVIQRQKQIGILKAMGIKDGMSSIIFLTQGFLLGLMGAIVGLLLGILLIVAFTTFALNPDGTPLIPMKLDPGFIALSGAIAITASTLASLLPAAKSKNLNPIEVIRNG
jgi:lipoprotein-releasing system permease protein